MTGMEFVDLLHDFVSNPIGRGQVLLVIAAIVRWPQYFVGNWLKATGSEELAPTIPWILFGLGLLLGAMLLSPLQYLVPGVAYDDLMLVAGGSALLAKKTHDDQNAAAAKLKAAVLEEELRKKEATTTGG